MNSKDMGPCCESGAISNTPSSQFFRNHDADQMIDKQWSGVDNVWNPVVLSVWGETIILAWVRDWSMQTP